MEYKESQKFADHLQDKNEAVSKFAIEKTLQEQRQYLPIFAVRQEVRSVQSCLSVILYTMCCSVAVQC